MVDSSIILEGLASQLKIKVDNDYWAKCYWITSVNEYFLGAEVLSHLAGKLLVILFSKETSVVREISARSFTRGFALSEQHHSVYSLLSEKGRTFYSEDASASPVGTMEVSIEQCNEWKKKNLELLKSYTPTDAIKHPKWQAQIAGLLKLYSDFDSELTE
jgi:hypothetical protein